MKSGFQLLLAICFLPLRMEAQTQIDWFSTQDATNLTSDGVSPMDGDFRFELGVFKSPFVPTSANTAQWAENWVAAQRLPYLADLKKYGGSVQVTSNSSPFTAGKEAYVWGFRGGLSSGEWILFRAASWQWPAVSGGPPSFVTWDARDATAVLNMGSINFSGSPSLMRSVSVANALPPATTWSQWQAEELSGDTTPKLPHEDADGDGTANILEFVFGTPPKSPNPSPMGAAALVDVSGSRYLQLTVPRRLDRPATLVVEVSSDLVIWNSGTDHTVVVSSTQASLIVSDLTPLSPGSRKRFIRLKASVPAP